MGLRLRDLTGSIADKAQKKFGRQGPLSALDALSDLPPGTSFELGACYAPVSSALTLSPREMQVFALLRTFRSEIIASARKHQVTPLAIAGAIAWEALENPMRGSVVSNGLGKIHYFNSDDLLKKGFGFKTLAVEAEEAGFVPQRTFGERVQVLATPEGSIEYIGAIMRAISKATTDAGFPDIRGDAGTLTNVYQAHTLASWKEHLKTKPKNAPFKTANPMALWVEKHQSFLEEAVGRAESLGATSELMTPEWQGPKDGEKPTKEPETPGLEFLEKPPLP